MSLIKTVIPVIFLSGILIFFLIWDGSNMISNVCIRAFEWLLLFSSSMMPSTPFIFFWLKASQRFNDSSEKDRFHCIMSLSVLYSISPLLYVLLYVCKVSEPPTISDDFNENYSIISKFFFARRDDQPNMKKLFLHFIFFVIGPLLVWQWAENLQPTDNDSNTQGAYSISMIILAFYTVFNLIL